MNASYDFAVTGRTHVEVVAAAKAMADDFWGDTPYEINHLNAQPLPRSDRWDTTGVGAHVYTRQFDTFPADKITPAFVDSLPRTTLPPGGLVVMAVSSEGLLVEPPETPSLSWPEYQGAVLANSDLMRYASALPVARIIFEQVLPPLLERDPS